ncbi:MAG: hypothetical protein ACMUIG_09185 [Thermoplasmatota archaeon]
MTKKYEIFNTLKSILSIGLIIFFTLVLSAALLNNDWYSISNTGTYRNSGGWDQRFHGEIRINVIDGQARIEVDELLRSDSEEFDLHYSPLTSFFYYTSLICIIISYPLSLILIVLVLISIFKGRRIKFANQISLSIPLLILMVLLFHGFVGPLSMNLTRPDFIRWDENGGGDLDPNPELDRFISSTFQKRGHYGHSFILTFMGLLISIVFAYLINKRFERKPVNRADKDAAFSITLH